MARSARSEHAAYAGDRWVSPYARGALKAACRRITGAPVGEQAATLSTEGFWMGALAGVGGIPAAFARDVLLRTASQIPSDGATASELEATVRRAFDAGFALPRFRREGEYDS